jgi:hypothetical protein
MVDSRALFEPSKYYFLKDTPSSRTVLKMQGELELELELSRTACTDKGHQHQSP